MNAQRRKAIKELVEQITAAFDRLIELREQVDTLLIEEDEAFENLPRSLQDSERGQAIQAAIEALETASTCLDALDSDSIISSLEDAAQ